MTVTVKLFPGIILLERPGGGIDDDIILLIGGDDDGDAGFFGMDGYSLSVLPKRPAGANIKR